MTTTFNLGTIDRAFASAVLNMFDRRLGEAVAWGFYDLALGLGEIEEMLGALSGDLAAQWEVHTQRDGYNAAALVSDFVEAGFLYEDPLRPSYYRTRFAEGVRLLAKLRQMFREGQWPTAPSLVSDLKIHLAERTYPLRSEAAAACLADLAPHCRHLSLQQAVFQALASDADGHPLKFAGFQRRAFADVLAQLNGTGLSGSVVSAGTGAGKTKAFYIPAFLSAVAAVRDDPAPSTKVIAIYPRNVLLADQLREALAEAAKIQPVLEAAGVRPLTFGAVLGDTPPSSRSFDRDGSGRPSYAEQFLRTWTRRGKGYTVSFLRSPVEPTEQLVWRDVDRAAGRTCLFRASGDVAAPDVPDGVLRLTREQIQRKPPDVLFLSLEMLNQQMGNPEWASAFGLGPDGAPKPRLLLLDEVHTYEGITGAQAAWVLRRWRHWGAVQDLHVVGLSATLQDAPRHLARVAGVPETAVHEFRPRPNELEAVDLEYNVAVKGNPAAGASLLATTIQTAMLLPRLLTPRHAPRAAPGQVRGDSFFGRKVFGFTDKLDVLNRWFSDLKDAEERKHLPRLRMPVAFGAANAGTAAARARELEGQSWGLPTALGHALGQHLAITRCSSQDPGANAASDLIVATASLEVGFDDPDVGATLHHKRPRSLASFIQRKGRAGRRRGTRPWTVVVLSDYGADRWAFQNVETLFRPEVGAIHLPLANAHVLRMQAVYFLVEWISRRLKIGNAYEYLRPGRGAPSAGPTPAQAGAAALLRELLEMGALWRSFRHDFRALFRSPYGKHGQSLADSVLDGILWDAPRPLLLQAVPTLLRMLEAGWAYAAPALHGRAEDAKTRRPLPRFIPPMTFAELDVGEARLHFGRPDKRDEFLGTGRALVESCPGHVSKRYAVHATEEGYWLAFSAELARPDVPPPTVAGVAALYPESLFLDVVDGTHVYEPQAIPLVAIDPRVTRDTSRGSWTWQTRVRAFGDGQPLPVLVGGPWTAVVRACRAYLHRDYARLEVLRYANECRYELRGPNGGSVIGRVRLASPAAGDAPARAEAVGFRKVVDGIAVDVAPEHLRSRPPLTPALIASLRADYYRDLLLADTDLGDDVSVFHRDWLWQTSLAMLTATAAATPSSGAEALEEAQVRLAAKRPAAARKVLDSIFQVRDVDALGEVEQAKLLRRLEELWDAPDVVRVLARHERVLWGALDAEVARWSERRYVAAIAQAVRAAAVARVPDLSEDDLALDVLWAEDGGAIIYLTELESGGVGAVERIVTELRRDPDAFHAGVRHHLEWCPREDRIANVRGVVDAVSAGGAASDGLREAFEAARTADTVAAAETAHRALETAVAGAGFIPTRPLLVALMMRLLHPGTDAALDALVHAFNIRRDALSTALGVEVGAEAFSYHALGVSELRDPLVAMLERIGGQAPEAHQVYAVAQRLAFETCTHACPECLDQPNLYHDFGRPSRRLARVWLGLDIPEVRAAGDGAWVGQVRALFQNGARVRVVIPDALTTDAVPRVQAMLAEEVAAGYLLLPITLVRVDRRAGAWHLLLQLSEAEHA